MPLTLDRLIQIALFFMAAFISIFFAWIIGDIVLQGWSQFSFSFLVTPPTNAGRAGGISTIIISTLLILSVCLIVSIPLSLATALYLSEFSKRSQKWAQSISLSLNVLASVPSVVFGLFGNAFFSKILGFGFSILAGGLTLACMILPFLTRILENTIRTIPQHLRLSGESLGLSKVSVIFQIILPLAAPGMLVGLVLSIGRALAETAALIFTSGYVDRMPETLFDSGRSLSIHIYDLSMNVPGGDKNAYASTFILILLLIAINASTHLLTYFYKKNRIKHA